MSAFLHQLARAAAAAVARPCAGGASKRAVDLRGERRETSTGGARFTFPLLLAVALMLGAGSAQAGTAFCSDYAGGLIDGSMFPTAGSQPSAITIDMDCTFRNFPATNPLTSTLNFQTNDPSIYLIVFDRVWYTGNMACANIEHKLWVVNTPPEAFKASCQDLFIPVEKIDKQSPSTTASVGVPFTYTITIPVMYDPATGTVMSGAGSPNDLGNIRFVDDLRTAATGADLTVQSINAYIKGTGTPVAITNTTGINNYLDFTLPNLSAGQQVVIEITAVADNTPTNVAGTVFTNTAQWWFSRSIDVNGDGIIQPEEFFDPLPGEAGISQPMTIVEPALVVTKSASATTLNLTSSPTYTIDVQNSGGGEAWNATIRDRIPAGMCDYDPTSGTGVTAQIVAADGSTLVSNLTSGVDYTVTWSAAPTCRLQLTTLDTAKAKIAPAEHLIITYQSKLNASVVDGTTHTNVAGATQWFNAPSTVTGRDQYGPYTLSVDGTPTLIDYQDGETVTAALSGYFFLKSVENLTTATYPATTAAAGDTLRYTLQIQNFNVPILSNITIDDELDALNATAAFVPNTLALASSNLPGTATLTLNPLGGSKGTGSLKVTNLTLDSNQQYEIQFDITLAASLPNGTLVRNQASLAGLDAGVPVSGVSDDPFINGPAKLTDAGNDPTPVQIQMPGPLAKVNPAKKTAVVGEQFTYRITVPATPSVVPLYDVRILDDLSWSAADMRFVSAAVVSGGAWSLSNSGTPSSPVIEDLATGIDIPANGQAVIDITVELQDTATNQDGLLFRNRASYTYNRMNGNTASQAIGGPGTTGNMTVLEPLLASTKAVSYVSPAGKLLSEPAVVGDVLRYQVTVTNNGNSSAFDTSAVDTLPANVALVAGSAIARIGGTLVAGFVATPATLPSGALAWGSQNGDDTLDIPVGQSLVLTYHATVVSINGLPISNSVYVDWSSLDGASTSERTGAGCPAITAPDDYCTGPAAASVNSADTTSITKTVIADSYGADDGTLRVGDTATYRLTLNLQERTTRNVVVTDTLPTGLRFLNVVSVNGDTTAPYTALALPFVYAPIAAPTVTGSAISGTTLTWSLGDIDNTADGVTTNNDFVIEYRVVVAKDILAQQPTTNRRNNVTLAYTGSDPTATRLASFARLTLLQPVMTTPLKSATGFTSPASVTIATDVMPFHLESCNTTGLAPAYSVKLTDLLASQLDETSITTPVVRVGGVLLTAGSDYSYTPPVARGGTMSFVLNTPVNPGQCATVDYTIGFHTDVGPNQTWDNSVTLDEYWSLATPTTRGQQYGPLGPTTFTMTNVATIAPPRKVMTAPASGEATIGDEVVYRITVPRVAANAALHDVVVSDTLHGSLRYLSASEVSGNGFTLTDTSVVPSDVRLTIPLIPAGQQAIIEVHARVANNASANAGVSFTNTTSYTYAVTTGGAPLNGGSATTATPLKLIEPTIALGKSVANLTHPGVAPSAGDTLRYSLTFTASGGVAGDNFSNAFDVGITDALSLGLAYAGNATVSGAGNTIAAPTISGDGLATAQTLSWSLAGATADIDVVEGTVVTVSYDVLVLNTVVAGQALTNSATVQWTGLDGITGLERTGTATPAVNDYVSGPVTTSQTVLDNTILAKTRLSDTFGAADSNVRVGDFINYELRIHLDAGSHTGLSLVDTLPQGLQFEQVVSINGDTTAPYGAVTPFTHTNIAAPSVSGTAASGPTTVTWTLGDITNVADGNTTNDDFVIVYRARVLNNDVFAQTPSQTLGNSATLSYTTLTGPASRSSSASVSLLQPLLTVTKTATPAGGDTVVDANEVISYRVDITNSGNAPAYDLVMADVLSVGLRQGGVTPTSISLVTSGTNLPLLVPAYDAVTGMATWSFDSGVANTYTIPAGETLRVIYTVQADPSLGPGLTLTNAATATLYYSFDDEAVPVGGNVNDREVYGPTNTANTSLTTPVPGALLKQNTQPTATIGERFTYRITLPETPLGTALYDVRILDDLTLSSADLRFVGASVVSGGAWTLTNTSGSDTNLVIEDTVNGIDIPANGQAVVEITVELLNTTTNNRGLTFNNVASYSFNQLNGDSTTRLAGGPSATADMSVVEPLLTASKTVGNVTTGKAPGDAAAGGDTLEYVVTIPNSGDSIARDVNVVDTLPPQLALVAASATAQINGVAVAGFVVNPATLPGGALAWGRANGDNTLDIPAGRSLVLTYRVNVLTAVGAPLANSVYVDWTSRNNAQAGERTGAGCPVTTAPDDYCFGPATATVATTDTNTIAKSVLSDSWSSGLSTANDATLRVGDTVIYRVGVTLRQGLTENVVVRDTLPAGLVFDGVVSINGDSSAAYSGAGVFSYSDIPASSVPAPGQSGTITWSLGNIDNAVDNNTANDTLVIEYRARVVIDTLAHTATTPLTNSVALSYTGGDPAVDPLRLTSSSTIEVRQPVVISVTKSDRLGRIGTLAAPLNVNVATDVMQFRLEACNDSGATAPAYSLLLSDVLASELNETSLALQAVTVNGVVRSPSDYLYTAPTTRGGTLSVRLNVPVNPGQCATVDYNIGFHTDLAPNQTWNNSVSASEYWSLPAATGEQYLPVGPAQFWMTNNVTIVPPLKSIVSPATEATIGETVTYQITVPGAPVNAALNSVVASDTLDPSLAFVAATATLNGAPLAIATSQSGQDLSWNIGTIPAGQQAVITLTTRVANSATTNAGGTFTNAASYSYGGVNGGSSAATAPLTIVEPLLTVSKAVAPNVAPTAGDILTFTVNLTAQSGVNLSSAFDTGVVDTLTLGLAYVAGTAQVGGVAVEPLLTGDGVAQAQTLAWSDIDVPEGTTVAVTYSVRVLDGVTIGQSLGNSVTARWTSLDGASTFERSGSTAPAYNDYVATATVTLPTVSDTTTLTKTHLSDTYGTADTDLRIGDLVEYQLRLGLQEGTHTGVVLTDTLPTGMVFEGMVSADFFGTPGTVTPTVSGQTLTWNLGTVVNATADNNPANDYLVITYRARVVNGHVLAQTPTTQSLTNNATLDYTVAGVPAPAKLASQTINALQPFLAVSKTVAPAGGDTVIDANEWIDYTVDIVNSGAAPAYDTVLVDTLPRGLRQGGVTTTAITLVGSGTSLPLLVPAYSAASGVATWNFDSGVDNQYTIPAGETLRVTYRVRGDASLGGGLTLTNAAQVSLYYSYDDEGVPANGNVSGREIYGPTNTATTTLTTPLPGALAKANTQPTAAVGERFKYTITVPAVAATTALHDVRIVDDLTASAADLRFVSVAKVSGSAIWTPVNTGTATNLVIEDTTSGIDIPAGEQAVIEITVELLNTPTNVSGLTFSNSADYTYNKRPNAPATQAAGLPGTTGDMTIVGPDSLTLQKSGPVTMRVGLPGTFTLNVQNTGTARAWDVTIVDKLPNPTPGGMCSVAPTITSAQLFLADGTSAVSAPLVAGTDYTVNFVTGAPACTFTFTALSAAAAIDPTQRLIISYQTSLDGDNSPNMALANVAAATQWFSQDTSGAGASGETRTYSGPLTDGTVGTLDNQDAHTVTTEAPVLVVQKTVENVTTGQNPGTNAQPGDRLRYTISVNNISPVDVPNFSLLDDLGALNPAALFVPGSMTITALPAGADSSSSNSSGGTNGAGLLDVRNLSLGAQGTPTASVTVVFEVTLAPTIASGTLVLNQGHLSAYGYPLAQTDDPNINGADDPNVMGDENPTRTVITSAPQMQVQKISQDMTGDPAVLLPGDTLRYTITVKNIGNENAVAASLRDLIPSFTTYVANTTRLNGVAVADPAAGVSALQAGMLVNAPEDTTAGALRADASATTANVATITFDVVINSTVLNGTLIANQGFVNGSGAGSGPFVERPSDDPATAVVDDPTRDIVGSLPLLDAQKLVSLQVDTNGNGAVDPGDVLRYTLTLNNFGAIPATGVVLTDAVPANTTYLADSVTLNGSPVGTPDGGLSPLIAGVPVNSATSASGTIAAASSAVVTFDVQVNAAVAAGTVISNQGLVAATGLPSEPTDADGNDSNGDQPTIIVVASAQQLAIVKEVFVVGGGAALAGGQLDYVVTVTNTGTTPATTVVLRDDLTPLAGQVSYVAGSATLNGLTLGVSYVAPVVSGDYSTHYGSLAPGATATLRFRVQIANGLPIATRITNTGEVAWNTPALSASSSVSIDTGGIPGSAILNGHVWHDANFSNLYDASEADLTGWTVGLYRNNVLLGSVTTDANGLYSFSGLAPTVTVADQYELRFSAPGAGANTASLGMADSLFTNGPQRITAITALSGSNLQELNLPIDPNGVVYDSILRTPIMGATLTMVRAGSTVALPGSCFDDPAQQGQVTQGSGFYKFDINFSDPSCAAGDDYVIRVTPPGTGYMPGPSQIIPAISSDTTAAYSVASCSGDALATPAGYCEAQASQYAPGAAVPARTAGTNYYLHLTLAAPVPGDSQIFNNHIAIDPRLDNALTISKTAAVVNVSRGQFVPYTITVNNTLAATLSDISIVDTFPPGFKYVAGSARVDGQRLEPVSTNRQLSWNNLAFATNTQHTIKLLFIVGSGVGEGEYVNRAQVFNMVTGGAASGEAMATVRVVPDPTFDCTDVIGKVFDDANQNGYQDQGEKGLPGVRVVSARGLLVKTDEHGRFHITCALTPDANRGSNYILKVDDRTLPSGYRITTENPRVQRATRGKMMKFNFGVTIHKVVRLDLANGVFEPGTTEMRIQWKPRLGLLMNELKKARSTLRVAYMAEVEDGGLVQDRLKAVKEEIARLWAEQKAAYELTIETEVFWRTGAPPDRSSSQ